MDPKVLAALVRYVRVGTAVLAARILTLLGLFMCAGGFAWALWGPSWERVAAASAFAVLVFWPVVRLDKGKEDGQVATTSD